MATEIHYDCDPGQDDAVALLYALASPNINVRSVSVVGGNTDVDDCAFNALRILALAGRTDIPVYKGAQQPLQRPLVTLPGVFGADGLAGGETLPPSPRPVEAEPANRFLERLLTESSRPVTLCMTGPLTNLALVLQRRPDLAANVTRLVLMGGCPYPDPITSEMGNFTSPGSTGLAEYNFGVDPEAAVIVLGSAIADITIVGLNVTRQVLYGTALDTALRGLGNPIAQAAANILAAVGGDERQDYRHLMISPDDPVRAMHDVMAMASIDTPYLFESTQAYLKIYTEEGAVPGLCRPVKDKAEATTCHPIRIMTGINKDGFIVHLLKIFAGSTGKNECLPI